MGSWVIDILNSPWAIKPGYLEQMHEIVRARADGEVTDWLKTYRETGEGRRPTRRYEVRDRVALVPIDGVLTRRANMMDEMSGGTSMETIGRDIQVAALDDGVDGIVLMVSSPGGTVAGTETLANIVASASQVKPVAAWAEQMCSAAYWIGCSAGSVWAAAKTSEIGSIGVVSAHKDISGADEKAGVKVTEITAGRYKRIASAHEPLSKEGREYIQAQIDELYVHFIDHVAARRNVTAEKVHEIMADGREFSGQKAAAVGLVNGIASLDEVMNKVRADASAKRTATQRERLKAMNRDELMAAHPELVKSLIAEGHTAGAASERARVAAIMAEGQEFLGHDELIAKCIADGTDAAAASKLVMKAEREKLAGIADERLIPSDPLPNSAPASKQDEPAKQESDPNVLLRKARAYQLEQAAKNITVPLTEAVLYVNAGL